MAGTALDRIHREGNPAAFMMVDLDNFKPVNGNLGHAEGDEPLRLVASRMAVNLSAIQFRHAGLAGRVALLLDQVDLPGEALELEITETMLMENMVHNQGVLSSLKTLGGLQAIDDFGTGYAALYYLKRFEVGVLKIGKSFVDGLGADANNSAVVRAIISLARNMDLVIVAEGVETEGQLNELSRYDQGDIMVQGYHFSRPVTAGEFERRYLSEASS